MTRRRGAIFALVAVVLLIAAGAVWWVQRGPDAGSVERAADWPTAVGGDPPTGPERMVGRFDDIGRISGGAFITGDDGDLVAETIGGDRVWRYQRADAEIANFDVLGTHVAVHWDDDVVTGIDAAGGDPSWAMALPEESDAGDANYRVAVTSNGGAIVARLPAEASEQPQTVIAIDQDGDEAWSSNLPAGCETGSGDIVTGESTVVVYTSPCETRKGALLLGLDRETGQRAWQQDVSSQYRSIQTLDGGRLALLGGLGGGAEANSVPIVDAASGRIEQRVAPFDEHGSAVAYSAVDGLVAWRDDNATPDETGLSVWSVTDKREVWSRPGLGPDGKYSPPVATGDVVYYIEIDNSTDRATLVTSALDDGRELSRTKIPDPAREEEWTYAIAHARDGVVAVRLSVPFGRPYPTYVFADRR